MKNFIVIDGAQNCVYDVFAVTDDDFSLILPDATDDPAQTLSSRTVSISAALVRRQDKQATRRRRHDLNRPGEHC